MASDNGDKKEKFTHCPFLDQECIKEKCAIFAELLRDVGGVQTKTGSCSLRATVMMLSELNIKAQLQLQRPKIHTP